MFDTNMHEYSLSSNADFGVTHKQVFLYFFVLVEHLLEVYNKQADTFTTTNDITNVTIQLL
jgi:hypothetical protein